jgi:hypothetical protein
LLALSLATAASGFFPIAVRADRPETAPADLKAALTQIDAAANRRDVEAVVQFYAPTFRNSDGLTRQTLQQALTNLWQRYPTIAYKTELKSWKQDGAGIQAETVTRITGTQKVGDRTFQLDSTLQAQQRFENQKIVQQEILNERSQITSGSNPPKLKLNLPQQVKAGQEFSLDAIVQEPLGTDLLLGAALEEPVKPDGFVNATNVNLEPLPGGGIFKVGRAPATAENRWISAVVMRQDGFTMVTQRLRVVSR